MTSTQRSFALLFGALTICHLLILYFGWDTLHMVVKPMFMPVLMGMLYRCVSDRKNRFYRLMQFGLLFSWFGDIALMLDRDNPLLFIAGLSFFLIAHLGYAAAFAGSIKRSGRPFSWAKAVGISAAFGVFTGIFFFQMKDGLEEMFVPVLAYTVVITIMGILSALRHGHAYDHDFKWILIGAVLFILSDCVIAWNKFVVDFPHDQVLNMSLYLSGQFLLAFGTIRYLGQSSTK